MERGLRKTDHKGIEAPEKARNRPEPRRGCKKEGRKGEYGPRMLQLQGKCIFRFE
jgi:hypothetical protein